jgi:acetyl-CoA C-acetyltransferase
MATGALDPRTPVLVGVGQVTNHLQVGEDLTRRDEPVTLMVHALRRAAEDTGGNAAGRRLLERAQSIRVIVPLSWGYANPGVLVAAELGIEPAETVLTTIGGNSPQSVVSQSALAIAAGGLDVALVTGADCIASRIAVRRHPDRPLLAWTTQPETTPAPSTMGLDRVPVTDVELDRGLDRPARVYPLFENALRYGAGRTIDEHQEAVAQLWARFSEVAAANPFAWSREPRTPDAIKTRSPDNRMIAFPYLKRMNANDRVDQAAALIVCSAEAAKAAGVPRDRFVFPISGADANDHWFLTHRADFTSSPAIRLAGRCALARAGVGIDDVAYLDLYSCFPSAVEIGATELGLDPHDPGRQLTLTGGLGFAGGPGNNYVTHSIATLAARLRSDPGALGMVTGLGWYMTKHAMGLYSTEPPAGGFRYDSPQDDVDALPQCSPAGDYEGDATVETYTVVHGADGEAELAILALRTDDGRRTWANASDSETLAALEASEGCGRAARVSSGARAELRSIPTTERPASEPSPGRSPVEPGPSPKGARP